MRLLRALHGLVGLAALSGVACDERGGAAPTRPAATTGATGATGATRTRDLASLIDAATLGEPPPRGGDLLADIAGFTTLDACIHERSGFDPVLGDAILALGYDAFARDACRVLEAAKTKSREPCRAISVTSLRKHCEAVFAVHTGDADACPEELTGRGREATCLALARRDVRLCAGELDSRRARCEAIVTGTRARCAQSREGIAACERDVERWRAMLGSAKASSKTEAPVASFNVYVPGGDAGASVLRPLGSTDLGVSRGTLVVIDKATGRRRVEFGNLTEGAIPIGVREPSLRVVVDLGAEADAGKASATVRLAVLAIPGRAVTAPPAKSSFTLKATKLELERGGILDLEIDGTAGEGPEQLACHVQVKTFVRDVVVREEAVRRR